MAAPAREAKMPLLDSRIDILNRNALEASSANQVFRNVGAILALVRDEMADVEDSVQLSEYCFNVCEVLKPVIQGRGAGDLDESVRTALDDLERVMCEIEGTLRTGTDMPHIKYNKEEVEGHKLKIEVILGTLSAPSSPGFDKNLRMGERAPHLAPISPHYAPTTSVSESACTRLIGCTFAPHELPTLIEAVASSKDEGDTIRRLLRDDAQTLIDVIDKALNMSDLSPWTRKKCLRLLYRTCGHHALLPSALRIPVCYDRTGVALYRGGFADVWKGEYCGRDVAVKVIRTYSKSDLQKIIGRFCKEVVTWKSLRHPNVLPLIGVTMSEALFAMVSDWMMNGNINDFVKAHPGANRLELLGGVAKGLIYIHGQGMIHGDLKGVNILIDQACNARLADFGLLTIISDPKNLLSSSSYAQGGTARWMSPELIVPQRSGLKNNRPTKHSDCYALGMVIYETISGHVPFHRDADLAVFVNVLAGERPPRGVGFAGSLWKTLELCWASQPNNRPSIEDVLQCLETISNLPEPYSPGVDEETESSDGWDSADGSPDVGYDHGANTSFPSSLSNFSVNPVNHDAYLDTNRATTTTGATSTSLSPPSSSMPSHVRDKLTTSHSTHDEAHPQFNSEGLSATAVAAPTDPPKEGSTRLRGDKVEEVAAERTLPNAIHKTAPPTPGSDDRAINAGYERSTGNSVLLERPSPAKPSSPRHSASSEFPRGGIISHVDGDSPGSTLKDLQHGYPWMGDITGNSTAMQVSSKSTPVPAKEEKPGIRPLPQRPAPAPISQAHPRAPSQQLLIPPYPNHSFDVPPPTIPTTIPTTKSALASHTANDSAGSTAGTWQKTLQSDRRKSLPRLVVDRREWSGPGQSSQVPSLMPLEHPSPSSRPNSPQDPPSSLGARPNDQASVFNEKFRPSVEEVYNRLGDFFPEHDLDGPMIEATSSGTSPMSAEVTQPPPTLDGRKRKKSIRLVANERDWKPNRAPGANTLRRRSTKLWGSKVEPEPISKWVRGELISKGTYGNVYLALNTASSEMFVVKQVEIPRTANDRNSNRQVTVVEALKLESETLKNLDHPHVVRYLGFEETPRYLSIFLEYVPGGSIANYLRKQGRFNDNLTKYFTAQILDGLDYLHSEGIIHRNLKADNILVEEFGLCKITGFVISKRTDDINMMDPHTPMQGSVFWMAPEVINVQKNGYNSKVDIWSVGCVTLEMWTGERPWSGQEAIAVLFQVSRSNLGLSPQLPEGVTLSPQADDFRKRCFSANPEERPTAGELRQHPYLVLPPGWEFNGFQ